MTNRRKDIREMVKGEKVATKKFPLVRLQLLVSIAARWFGFE